MSDTIPVAQLRAFVERIERIEADIKDLNGDKSEVYKELRGCGFDVKAVRAVVAKRKLDTTDREERDAMFDLYWSALNGTGTDDATRVHVHGASYSEAKGRGAGERLIDAAREMRGMVGELTDTQESDQPDETDVPATAAVASDEQAAQDDVGATASSTNSEMDRATEGSFETGSEAAENARKAIPAGPEDGSVSHAGAGEIPATHSNSPAAIPLGAANSVGEAPSSSPASPARHSDDIDLTIPAFLDRRQPKAREWEDA